MKNRLFLFGILTALVWVGGCTLLIYLSLHFNWINQGGSCASGVVEDWLFVWFGFINLLLMGFLFFFRRIPFFKGMFVVLLTAVILEFIFLAIEKPL